LITVLVDTGAGEPAPRPSRTCQKQVGFCLAADAESCLIATAVRFQCAGTFRDAAGAEERLRAGRIGLGAYR